MRKIISVIMILVMLLPICRAEAALNETERKKFVALTFDDGPHKAHTRKILDTLERHGVRATFFIVGENAERYPELVKEIAIKGHEIGNHTYSHPKMTEISYDELKDELEKNDEIIFSVTGIRTTLFRPPCGKISESVSSVAEDGKYKLVLWDIDTRDWEHTPKDKIVSNVINNVKPGSVVLMHDFIGGKTHTPEALGEIIEKLRAKGYEFVTVSELY